MSVWELRGTARVSKRAADRVRRGHPWIYRSDIDELPSENAGLVRVEAKGRTLGIAMMSPASVITLRLVGERFDRDTLRRRLEAALTLRRRALPDADAFRVVHGESDHLPGLYVDRYSDCVAIQSSCAAANILEPFVIEDVDALLSPRVIVLRDDIGGRRHEGLREHVTVVKGEPPVVANYHEGDVEFRVDLLADQKTGSFLDQVANHVAAGRYARGRGLDTFTYHGGFALQLARGCDRVLAVDSSAPALARVRENAERAGLTNVETREANAFDLLRNLDDAGERFDTIVLDPPAFASSKHTVRKALRAYKEINLRALKMLSPGGILITCSCSGRVTATDLEAVIGEAARDAHRTLSVLERRGAGPDHPARVGMPESEYLKCLVCALV
jgi:23S rRNA (cytosine1962-C5)-methyltransferase